MDLSTNPNPKRKWVKIIIGIFFTLALLAGAVAFYLYNWIFGINLQLQEDAIITIHTNQNIEQLAQQLEQEQLIKNANSFKFTAQQMNYKPKSGKFKIPAATKDNYALVRALRGSQLSIKLTFHNFRLKQQLAAYVGSKIEADSSEIIQLLNDANFLNQFGFTPNNVMALFIPNTYEVYWNCSANEFWERMLKEYKKFWTEERLQKAKKQGLTPVEVYTLASIVECESQYEPERPRIAGVYLNRLRKEGWRLEADPTVVFAVGDFSITRVLNSHLATESPYNTYKNAGLPPGPIYMASINAVDAVLNAEEHDYMFFCAKVPDAGQPSSHAFAKTLNAHLNNARAYWKWIRTQ